MIRARQDRAIRYGFGKATGQDVKRAFKALKRALLPERIRARKAERRWRRKDRSEWLPADAESGGPLDRYGCTDPGKKEP